MLLVDLLQLLKLVLLVLVAEQSTVRADRYLARLAIVAQSRVVLLTELFSALLVLILLLLHQLHDIGEEATWYELVCAQAGPAMGALRPCLLDPLFQACATGKFGAVWAHDRVLNGAEAYEATEELVKLDLAVGAPAAAIGPDTCVDRLDTRSAIVRPSRSQRWYIIIVRLVAMSMATSDHKLRIKGQLTYWPSLISLGLAWGLLVLLNLL